ncbi:MAG: peptidyl-prolyl cis-trans isomerase [Flavobacteriaceae bacterium]
MSLCSCELFKPKEEQEVIARVNDVYLYKSDFIKDYPENLPKQDSLLFVNQYVDNWATKQLLKQKAILNLDTEKLLSFDQLAEDYKLDLYTNAYLNALITKKLDTIISKAEFDTLFKNSKESFRLNEELLKFRYVVIDKAHTDLKAIETRFKRYDSIDKVILDSLSIQFHSFMLNDSIWVKKSQLLKKLPINVSDMDSQLLKKSNFIQFEDSIRLYLVQINDLLKRNEQAPQEYMEQTLQQIILNKRKLKLIKQLEIDVRKDAIQNQEFEVYN